MKKDLGCRKIQRTGKDSYIVTLPKKWVQETGLERGCEIAFKQLDDLSLILTPRKTDEGSGKRFIAKEYWISIEPKDNIQSACRKIKALYSVGADFIHVRFKGRDLSLNFKETIKNFVREMLLGSEIIDESADELTIQILIKHPEFPVDKAIRRMAVLALSADRDSLLAVERMDHGIIQHVLSTCSDVNRLNLYVVRQLKFGIEQNLFRELGFRTPKEFLAYRIMANDIKSIAENAKNVVNTVAAFKKHIENETLFLKDIIDTEVYCQILDFNSMAHGMFEESLKAAFKWDYKQADKLFPQIESRETLGMQLATILYSKKLDPNASSILWMVLDGTKRILEYGRDIAEVTLNKAVEDICSIYRP
ncbi:MAG: phosphate uptake regulator PhoU [Nitrososphaerota archaeon]|nr:phosphate uptake regulator PhoU [Nitrososphaerota archaeon]